MKALTVKQPWAQLIVDGYKKYEFRGWKTKYRGKILIHAGMSLEKDMMLRFKDYNLDCMLGAIIGEAELVDCILVDSKFNEELRNADPIVYGRSNHTETYAWKLENVIKYDAPIFCKGQLGLWNYDVDK
ncbi:MAG: ASCH domain-containing protein [Bacilli bacterium]|nr:ASCH domain-containing protein [Bacilli bacterium]